MYFSDLNGTEPHGCELVVHVPCAEVAVAGLGVFLFARMKKARWTFDSVAQ